METMETTEKKWGFLFSVISYVSLVSYNSTKKGAKREPNFYNINMKWLVKAQYWLFDPQKLIQRWLGILLLIYLFRACLTQ
tara:strand:+ start:76 stop:318 length:243 start_codon:yes stop_codon:yes gene_type:complete